MKKSLTIILLLVILLIGAVAIRTATEKDVQPILEDTENDKPIETEKNPLEKNESTNKQLPVYIGQAIEVLGTDPIIQQIPEERLEAARTELARVAGNLANNPDDYDAWLYVASTKKFVNNFEGARDAWSYATLVEPKFGIAYFNLGNLYGSYLNDYEAAKVNYAKAIEFDGQVPYPHIGAADFYDRFLEDREEAIRIIEQGLERVPNNPDLLKSLEEYKK